MELQISRSICTEISKKDILWRKTNRNRKNTAGIMWMEGGNNRGSGSVPGSHTHAHRDTAKDERIEFHGIFKGKEQLDHT